MIFFFGEVIGSAGYPLSVFEVVGGIISLTGADQDQSSQRLSVSGVTIHPGWVEVDYELRDDWRNDVCVLELESDGLEFGPSVQPLAVEDQTPTAGTTCTVAGWGVTSVRRQLL